MPAIPLKADSLGGGAALALSYERGLCGPVRSGRGT
jgi:hypothetical protein